MDRRLTVALVALTAMAGSLGIGAPVAGAQSVDEDVIVATFDGTTTALGDNNCAGGAIGCVPIAEPGPCKANNGIAPGLGGGLGCFAFTGAVPASTPGAGCLFTDTNLAPEMGLCSGVITAGGNYNNNFCGTGIIDGWASITSTVAGEGPL